MVLVKDFKVSEFPRMYLGEGSIKGYENFIKSLPEYCPSCKSPLSLSITLEGGLICSSPICVGRVANDLIHLASQFNLGTLLPSSSGGVGCHSRSDIIDFLVSSNFSSAFDIFSLASSGRVSDEGESTFSYSDLRTLREEVVSAKNLYISTGALLEPKAFVGMCSRNNILLSNLGVFEGYSTLNDFYSALEEGDEEGSLSFLDNRLNELDEGNLIEYGSGNFGTDTIYSNSLLSLYVALLKEKEFLLYGYNTYFSDGRI